MLLKIYSPVKSRHKVPLFQQYGFMVYITLLPAAFLIPEATGKKPEIV